MAHYRLKQADEARTTWAKAVEIANTKLPKPDSIDLGAGWVDWIIDNALMSEARALIDNPNASDETK